jgi:hypothetical protein
VTNPWLERFRQARAAALFLGLSLVYLRPIWRVFRTHLAPDLGDPLFNLVILDWGTRTLSTGISGIFGRFWNAPFFFPAQGVTTLSDHLLGPAAFSTLGASFGLGTIAAYNLLFLGSFAASGFATYWVLRRSGRSEAAALLGGMAFAFAPFRWDQASHLQVLLTPWLPLVLWHFDRLLVEGTWRRAGWFLLFYTLHVTGGSYLAYMIHVPLAVLFAHRLAGPARVGWTGARLRVVGIALLCALALSGAIFAPYLSARHEIVRRDWDARRYGASVVTWLTPAVPNLYSAAFPPRLRRDENTYFPGFLPSAFAVVAIVEITAAARRRRRSAIGGTTKPRVGERALLALAGLAFVLSEVRTWLGTPQVRALNFKIPILPYTAAFGIAVIALGIYSVLRWRRHRAALSATAPEAPEEDWNRGLVLAGTACALLAFPIVYAPLMKIVPGFSAMRVPGRFLVFASFAVAALAARGFDRWLDSLRARGSDRRGAFAVLSIGVVILGLLAIELAPRPLAWHPLPAANDFPPVYRFLARRPVAAVLELPIGAMLDDLPYMYFATVHHRPLVNGYSGFMPPENQAFRDACCTPVPDTQRLALLRRWGVTHVVVHLDRLTSQTQRRAARRWNRKASVRRVYRDDSTVVYEIAPRAKRPAPPDTIPGHEAPRVRRPRQPGFHAARGPGGRLRRKSAPLR